MRYQQETVLRQSLGNNAIDFKKRKKKGSDCTLRVPPLIQGTIDNVKTVVSGEWWVMSWVAYEYISDSWKLISASGLEYLVEIRNYQLPISNSRNPKAIYIIDNHNHAFYCRWKSYLEWIISRWSHLIHIDQHSDLNLARAISYKPQATKDGKNWNLELGTWSSLDDVSVYTNEVLDIASFIKPAKEIGLIGEYEMVLTEYSLLHRAEADSLIYQITNSLIIDIDLDFRAPEMSIQEYDQTIKKVRQLIALPDVWCITVATSPTYIDQQRALEVLHDLLN